MVLLVLTALIALVHSACLAHAISYVVVYDQDDDVVTDLVEFNGASLYNETHAIINPNASRVIISFRGVKLYELGEVEDNRLYEVKVPLSHLIIEVPKGLNYEVEHYATALRFKGVSDGGQIDLGLLPHGLIEIRVWGSQELSEVVNWQGGVIKISEEVKIEPKAFFLLLPSLLPALIPIGVGAYYAYRRHKLISSISQAKEVMPKPLEIERPIIKPEPIEVEPKVNVEPRRIKIRSDVLVKRKPKDRVDQILDVASKPPASIADLIDRDEDWLMRELDRRHG